MAKATFTVMAIRPGRHQDYMAYWKRNQSSNDKGETLDPNMLALTVSVEAKNKREAEAIVRQQYPDHSIDTEATQRLG